MLPTVKICGIMRTEDVAMCLRHGTDILGFVVDYPQPVPWNLSVASAKELLLAVSGRAKTCIVTGGPPDKVLALSRVLQPNYIQLHAGETLADVQHIVGELSGSGIKIIKAIFPDTPNLERTAANFCALGIHALLFDARTPANAGNGGAADISLFRKLQLAVSTPVILAGGINPENIADIILMSKARIIDLMTGVERCPGVKDESKIVALFQALQTEIH
ncbi:MAG: phosphoribosylanthranilate isomerase [Dehalococcoidia bacterium]|nr:phosphoribosylanthranilate isomerase [Dehalococcoidia bacterium]